MSAPYTCQAKSLSDNRGPRNPSQTGAGKEKRSGCRRYSGGALSRRTERAPRSQPLDGAKAVGMGYRIGAKRPSDATGTGTLMRRLPEMLLKRLPGKEAGRPLQRRAYPRFGRRRCSRLSKAH